MRILAMTAHIRLCKSWTDRDLCLFSISNSHIIGSKSSYLGKCSQCCFTVNIYDAKPVTKWLQMIIFGKILYVTCSKLSANIITALRKWKHLRVVISWFSERHRYWHTFPTDTHSSHTSNVSSLQPIIW